MKKALEQANKALMLDEVPVGAILVDNKTGSIINSAHNLVNSNKNSIAHSEILLINRAVEIKKTKFLNETSIFVTLEPCAMCAAAISEMHIKRLYFGAYDNKKGSLESIMRIYNQKNYFVPEVYGGINEKECANILKNFFIKKRKK